MTSGTEASSDDGLWTEIQIETGSEAADVLAAELAPIAGGVELRDGETLLRAPTGRAVVVVVCAPDDVDEVLAVAEATLAVAREGGSAVDPVVVRRREAHEDEWRDVWKQFFRATRIGKRFIVRPSWDPGAIEGDDHVIDLDPGRAFGTGAHPSTRLVLSLMERIHAEATQVSRFLDLGCGSGILSIAGARLWPAAEGWAIDVDPEAAACTDENLARNAVTTVRTRAGTLDEAPGVFDVALANIQMDVLELLAPGFPAKVRAGGHLVLSGLLADQGAPVAGTYERAGFRLIAREDEGEWAGLLFAKPA